MVDLLQIIRNVLAALPSLEIMFMLVSWVMGVIFVMMAVQGLSKRNDMGRNAGSWASPITTFAIGICFIALPGLLASLTQTLFSQETPDASRIFEYSPSLLGSFDETSAAGQMITGITTIVMFVGLIAVMRGLYLLNQSATGNGPKTFGPGFTFVIAGTFAVNFPLFVGMMERLVTANGS